MMVCRASGNMVHMDQLSHKRLIDVTIEVMGKHFAQGLTVVQSMG